MAYRIAVAFAKRARGKRRSFDNAPIGRTTRKFVKIWLEENKASRDAESADRTKAFRALLKKVKDGEAAASALKAGFVRGVLTS